MIMSSRSGSLSADRKLDARGPALYFLLAGFLLKHASKTFNTAVDCLPSNNAPGEMHPILEMVHFPWETMPDLISDTVTRIPFLANLTALLTWHTKISRSPFKSRVERSNGTANIPLTNAEELVKELKGYLARLQYIAVHRHCQGICYDYEFKKWFLTEPADRKFDAGGPALYFLLAGCSAMMGHLWTPRGDDFSRISSRLFSSWMSQSQPVSVRELMVPARQACEFPEFN